MQAATRPFQLDLPSTGPLRRGLVRVLRPAIEAALGFPVLNDIYQRVASSPDGRSFVHRSLAELDVHYRVCTSDLDRIPRQGPLIVVANHPFGGIDGMMLLDLLLSVRNDAKLLANFLLRRLPEMAANCIFVDPFGGEGAKQRNIASMKSAVRWVRDGGALGVFPAGEVSSLHLRGRRVVDGPWSETIGRLVRQTGAAVLPVYFPGRNSILFQLAGLVHPRLRTAMLTRELLRKKHDRPHIEIGSVITPQRIASIKDASATTAYLRARTYMLSTRADESAAAASRAVLGPGGRAAPHVAAAAPHVAAAAPHVGPNAARLAEPTIAVAAPAALLADEIAALPASQKLAAAGHSAVYCAGSSQIPHVLQEIGRLREISFRAVGEGTGKAIDLDRFDEHYQQLFVWHSDKQEVVGGYRIGVTDQIVEQHGVEGLYTHTLFRFTPRLLEQLGPAIELGRSFVRPEYQREFAPLMLLWRGLATFAAIDPRRKRLFGPVSISNEYQSMTRHLLMQFLKQNSYDASLGQWVVPRNPPRQPRGRSSRLRELESLLAGMVVSDIDQVSELVSEIEADRRGVPVLLRQYMKLNAKVLGFNVDPQFGDVLDALMLVDLTEVERAILVRYLGREGARKFLAFHGITL